MALGRNLSFPLVSPSKLSLTCSMWILRMALFLLEPMRRSEWDHQCQPMGMSRFCSLVAWGTSFT